MLEKLVRGTAKVSRRVFLAITAVVVAVVLGIAAILRLRRPPPAPTPTPTPETPPTAPPPTPPKADITVVRVDKAPIRNPDDPVWGRVPEVEFSLGPQAMVAPFKLAPTITSVKVKAVRDEEWIAFRLEWSDKEANFRNFDVHEFRDACAVMLLSYPIPQEKLGLAWQMGTPEYPATMLFWRADWQLEVEKGYQDITDIFPNMAVDVYPPYKGTVEEVEPKPKKLGTVAGELRYLGGFATGNPMVRLEKKTPVEKLIARGPGTIESFKTQDAEGWGKFEGGRWRVVIAKKLKASDAGQGEIEVKPGSFYHIAIAVWQGSEGDRGSRKAITPLKLMYVE